MLTRTGRCLCGAVTFEADLADLNFSACHCGMCRRWAGGPTFSKSVDALRVLAGADRLVAYRSSDWAERVHCGTCGSSLWYRLVASDRYIPGVGTFDDQSGFLLTMEVCVDAQGSGYAFAGPTKRMTTAELFAAAATGEGHD
jgi:hypothetical protein